jgi:TATA-box binding protein (TBP) (component of TFIID and TFIIIB)
MQAASAPAAGTAPAPIDVCRNCVVTMDVETTVPLTSVAASVRNAEYNPRRFSGLVLRMREPTATALVFSTGKVVITGIRNEDEGTAAGRRIAKLLHRVKVPDVKFRGVMVQNLVATGDCGFPVRLEHIAQRVMQERLEHVSCSVRQRAWVGGGVVWWLHRLACVRSTNRSCFPVSSCD